MHPTLTLMFIYLPSGEWYGFLINLPKKEIVPASETKIYIPGASSPSTFHAVMNQMLGHPVIIEQAVQYELPNSYWTILFNNFGDQLQIEPLPVQAEI